MIGMSEELLPTRAKGLNNMLASEKVSPGKSTPSLHDFGHQQSILHDHMKMSELLHGRASRVCQSSCLQGKAHERHR